MVVKPKNCPRYSAGATVTNPYLAEPMEFAVGGAWEGTANHVSIAALMRRNEKRKKIESQSKIVPKIFQ